MLYEGFFIISEQRKLHLITLWELASVKKDSEEKRVSPLIRPFTRFLDTKLSLP